jgi:hypothetical protein
VVQTAAKLVLEQTFEADFEDNANGYRPGRGAMAAVKEVHGGSSFLGFRLKRASGASWRIREANLKDGERSARAAIVWAKISEWPVSGLIECGKFASQALAHRSDRHQLVTASISAEIFIVAKLLKVSDIA